MPDIKIPVTVGGITFKNPFYVASGPTTKTVRQLQAIEAAGWAAASIKLSIDPAPYINRKPRYDLFEDRDALAFTTEKRLTFAEGLTLVREAKKVLNDLILFANITYAGDGGVFGWVNMAREFEKAGADIIELNMCCPNMSFNVSLTTAGEQCTKQQTGASLGQNEEAVTEIVRAIKKEIKIPLFVKLTPEGGRIAQISKAIYAAGADAVSGTGNRMGMPVIDLENPEKAIYHLQEEISMSCHSGAWLKPLAQRDTYEMRKLCGPDVKIAATGGIRNWRDAVEMVMCGGDLLGICAETLISGYDFVRPMIKGMHEYMESHGYKTIDDMKGIIVPLIKTAADVTLYGGYARITNPKLSAPCKAACPHHVPAQAYVQYVSRGDFKKAYEVITEKGILQGACAYICPHPCEAACVRGAYGKPVRIRELKRYVLEKGAKEGWDPAMEKSAPNGMKVAVIGACASGISAAFELSKAGYAVSLFEKADFIGGSMRDLEKSGELPAAVLSGMEAALKKLGADVKTGLTVSPDVLIKDGFNAVLLTCNAPEPIESNAVFTLRNRVSGAENAIRAAAEGAKSAVEIDAFLQGDAATLKKEPPLTVAKRENVFKRTGILPYEPPRPEKPIETDEEAIYEGSRCFGCGCGEGCQLCKTICTDFAPQIVARDELAIISKDCVACGMCYNRCPNMNIEMVNTGEKV